MKYIFLMLLLGAFNIFSAGIDFENDPFIIGMFSVERPSDRIFSRLKSLGINYIHSYNAYRSENPTAILDYAAKYDMKVFYDIRSRKISSDDQEWESKLQPRIDAVKAHPALGIWFAYSEPKTTDLPRVKEIVSLIRKSSDISTALVIHERAKYWDSRGYTDIWMVDLYPIRGQAFPGAPLQHGFTRTMRNAATSYRPAGTPFMAVLQACDFSCFASDVKPEFRETLRYPNLTEMRFMNFSSLCFGIRGLFFYSYYHCHLDRPAGKEFFNGSLKNSIADVKAFTDAVPKVWNVTARNSELERKEKIVLAYWNRPTGDYIVLANDSPEKRSLDINISAIPNFPKEALLSGWRFTREGNCSLKNSNLTVEDMQPWEVYIWKLTN